MVSKSLIASVFSVSLLSILAVLPSTAATLTLIDDKFTSTQKLFETGNNIDSSFVVITGPVFTGFPATSGSSNLAIPTGTEIKSIKTFNFNTGDRVDLSFNYFADGGNVSLGSFFTNTLAPFITNPLGQTAALYTKTFTVSSPGSARFDFTGNAPYVTGGTVISNFLLTNTTAATAVPEPFTIIGTLVGSMAAFRLKKKLKSIAR